jgi:hypothetical protein
MMMLLWSVPPLTRIKNLKREGKRRYGGNRFMHLEATEFTAGIFLARVTISIIHGRDMTGGTLDGSFVTVSAVYSDMENQAERDNFPSLIVILLSGAIGTWFGRTMDKDYF